MCLVLLIMEQARYIIGCLPGADIVRRGEKVLDGMESVVLRSQFRQGEPKMQCRMSGVLVAAALLSAALFAVQPASAQYVPQKFPAPWTYEAPTGPAQWGDLDPAYAACKAGTHQSPINLTGALPAELAPIKFDYKLTPLKIVNTGFTMQVNYEPGSSITVNGAVYDLVQFHFHHPTETAIDGQKYDLELHLVHRNAEGRLAVVSVLLKNGGENAPLRVLWNYLPKDVGKQAEHKKVELNAEDFLPNDRNYYKYSGSLTIPPCTEGVDWYVMKKPVEVSAVQIEAFAKFFPNNARPLQPANGRAIQESSFPKSSAE
jgi:carbonic anhydrase